MSIIGPQILITFQSLDFLSAIQVNIQLLDLISGNQMAFS